MKKLFKIILWVLVISTIIGAVGAMFSKGDSSIDKKEVKPETHIVNCDFNKVTIKASEFGTNKVIDEKTLTGCFNVKNSADGLSEISASNSPFKVLFYNENPLQFLNIRFGEGDPSQFRKNKGHDLFMVAKDGKLSFIFSDKKTITGSVIFEK